MHTDRKLFITHNRILTVPTICTNLLSDCIHNGRHKVYGVQVQIVTKHFGHLLRCDQLLVSVPCEAIAQLYSVTLDIQSYRHQAFWLTSVLMKRDGVRVIQTEGKSESLACVTS